MASTLADVWIYFADTSCRGYSPLYDRICRTVAVSGEVLELVGEAPPRGHQPNVLLGAVHFLLLGGLEHPLAAVYAGTSEADPGPLFVDLCLAHRAEILELLATRHTNTNEVGRSAVLGPALTEVAARCGEPLTLVDVGCSAGLNLYCDRYALDYGPAGTTGPSEAAVRVACDVIGGHPPIARVLPAIAERVGIDREPVDLADDDEIRWLLACVWPDTGRLPRTRLALGELRRTPPRVVRGDAVDAIGDVIATLPAAAATVVTTSWAIAYLPPARRIDFSDALATASDGRTVAWVSAESAGVVELFADTQAPSDAHGLEASVLGLARFRDGEVDAQVLAFMHPHGNWIEWRC
jgi:hypothetical protein